MARSASTLILALLGLFTLLPRPVMAGAWRLAAPVPGTTRSSTETKAWPDGVIPYNLHGLPHWLSDKIRSALRTWEQQTCVRFVPKGDHKSWAEFTNHDDGCHTSRMGYQGENAGPTTVNLDTPNELKDMVTLGGDRHCGADPIPAHEIGHLIGLVHEHQRSDAEKYIRVHWDKLKAGPLWTNQMKPWPLTENSEPYDYHSVMHYRAATASAGKGDSLEATTGQPISPDSKPTLHDYRAVNRLYKCPEPMTRASPDCVEGPANGDSSTYTFTLDEQTVKWMRQNNYGTLSVSQTCDKGLGGIGPGTAWGHIPLGNGRGGSAQPFTIKGVPGCRKGRSRHVSRYRVHLCRDDAHCDITCRGSEEGRRLCPTQAGTRIEAKAVSVNDTTLWVCHPL